MEFQSLLKRLARKLMADDIPYMVIGGQAVLLYGEPRLTKDIDLTLGVGIERLTTIKNIAAELNLESLVDDVDEFTRQTMVLPTIHRKSGIRVDFIFSYSPFELQAIERGRLVKLGKTTVRFASLEDVVIHKVIAGRPRDIEDIKSILLKNPTYDKPYVFGWLAKFDQSLNETFSESFSRIVEAIK